jgi:hypothetical protein
MNKTQAKPIEQAYIDLFVELGFTKAKYGENRYTKQTSLGELIASVSVSTREELCSVFVSIYEPKDVEKVVQLGFGRHSLKQNTHFLAKYWKDYLEVIKDIINIE